MSVALLESCFVSGPITPALKARRRNIPVIAKHGFVSCRCTHTPGPDQYNNNKEYSSRKNECQLAKAALVAMAAGVLALGSVDPASAAKSGGRVGGQAFRSSSPQPRSSGPRINNSRTNVYINPGVAPPLIGGYGYGYGGPYYGGWGWSPFSFFAPGPGVAVGGGFDFFLLFIALGAVSAVVRKFLGSREDDDEL